MIAMVLFGRGVDRTAQVLTNMGFLKSMGPLKDPENEGLRLLPKMQELE